MKLIVSKQIVVLFSTIMVLVSSCEKQNDIIISNADLKASQAVTVSALTVSNPFTVRPLYDMPNPI